MGTEMCEKQRPLGGNQNVRFRNALRDATMILEHDGLDIVQTAQNL